MKSGLFLSTNKLTTMSFVNAVYYPSWKAYHGKSPSCIQANSVTHVFYAFIRPRANGTLDLIDDWLHTKHKADSCEGCLEALHKFRHQHPGIKTLVSIGGGSGSKPFPELASNPLTRTRFTREVLKFVDQYGFDGVDIDWEHPTTKEEGANYVLLLQDLRKAMPEPTYLLTTALPVGEYCLKSIDLCGLGEVVDFLNLMGYDFAGQWTDFSGHHAQMHVTRGADDTPVPGEKSCFGGIIYAIDKGFPTRKIVLGVPAYARYFPGAKGPSESFSEAGVMDYNELPEAWITGARVESSLSAASIVDEESGKGFVSFDVPETVAMKARSIKELGLAGLFYWTAASDRDDGQSLVAAGFKELQSPEDRQASEIDDGGDHYVL